ncbi:glycosyltransferase family 4 protein [Paraburkholderia metrosideri]|uniref:GalNAc-alpha-(1->4)-GalNAc-alpha-(1->3)-diNAcBac-PP-undecaprenol alpha-1,4-N-acetyl-D-galactosaminyltransferase n=1 Tax=Paraburkholderia metrosideri TaxID=580937 RepID=A0ABN7HKY7_9BURK|nr:glycosyltransferase family 4 protein [Paraburkholderia metrosideri]CAD6524748.1 GalNAc-alpha-(1->4)-GalNAc-alpha-(1->3)-diNAcBac-PP-undecaprenol alpha-1,4-N-acetyl-D-galactosaminyltransferase [Paraburkholderia metrosideri]
MKILMLVSSMQGGGAERVASTLVNAWAARGDAVTLAATFSGRGACHYELSSNVKFVYLVDLAKQRGKAPRAYYSRFMALRSLIRASKPDVIVSFLTNVNITAILASRGLGVPVIVSERTNPLADRRSLFWKLLCKLVYPQASIVTLLTDSVVTPFRKVVPGIKRIAVVPSPLPDALLAQNPQPLSEGERKRVIALGRLHECKQFDLLVNAFSSIAHVLPDWDLWIWGEGPERTRLEAQIARLGMSGRIFLPGQTRTPWAVMINAQAFVLSSRHEGLPMALMEGMALGLPSVAFDCPSGPKELTCDGQDGLLIPPGDEFAMANGLRRLLSDELLRRELGKRGAASVRERYSSQRILQIWDELFQTVGAREEC